MATYYLTLHDLRLRVLGDVSSSVTPLLAFDALESDFTDYSYGYGRSEGSRGEAAAVGDRSVKVVLREGERRLDGREGQGEGIDGEGPAKGEQIQRIKEDTRRKLSRGQDCNPAVRNLSGYPPRREYVQRSGPVFR
nr:hypothetical protein CFP56_73136 [Quercus suber]